MAPKAKSHGRDRNLPQFKYELCPLSQPHHLRILKLRPGPADQETVDCELEEMESLTSDREYEAVSWYWGTGAEDQSIRIHVGDDAFFFPLREHLCDALIALRLSRKVRYLWIDYVCIDQHNGKEKSQQVPRMTEIYSNAKNVCVWLGKAHADSRLALKFIKTQVLNIWSFDELISNHDYVDSWNALKELMKRPWFSRRWVVQKIALAKKGTVYCGSESLDWHEFSDAISLFADIGDARRRLNELVRKHEKFNNARNFFQEVPYLGATLLVRTTSQLLKRSGDLLQRLVTLEEMVGRLASFETKEPRDTIFALLALAKDSYPTAEGIPTHLEGRKLTDPQRRALQQIVRLFPNTYRRNYVVNYKQPTIDVYQQFIAFTISRADPNRALDVLLRPFAQSYIREQDLQFNEEGKIRLKKDQLQANVPLPSWIPNVSEVSFARQRDKRKRKREGDEEDHAEPFGRSMKRQRGDLLVLGQLGFWQENYTAAGTRIYDKNKIRFRKRRDHYSIFLEGFVLDTVAAVEPASQLGNIPAGWFSRVQQGPKSHRDAFWRTLVADRGSNGRSPSPYYRRAIEAALEGALPDSDFDVQDTIDNGESDVVAEVLRIVQATIWRRRLIETEPKKRHPNGLLGLAPGATKQNDIICILYGCSVPVVIRRFEKSQTSMLADAQDDEEDQQRRLEDASPRIQQIFRRFKKPPHGANETATKDSDAVRDVVDHGAGYSHKVIIKPPSTDRSQAIKGPHDEKPPNHYYRIIGECYLDGMMNGEAIEWQNDTADTSHYEPHERVRAEIFEIR